MRILLSVVTMVFTATSLCWALEPREVLVVANGDLAASLRLSKYYMKKRTIPENNLLTLSVASQEHIRGESYEKNIAVPVRKYLQDNDPFRFIRCLVIMYGMPLRINRPQDPVKRKELKKLKARQDDLKKQIKEMKKGTEKDTLKDTLKTLKKKITFFQQAKESASVDSELALVLEDGYEQAGWIPNPFYLGYLGKRIAHMPQSALMVSRLDGPTADIVQRAIDATLATEEKGLQGAAYFDARWKEPDEQKKSGYAFYDQSIHTAARRIKEKGTMPVVIDDKQALFQRGDCPRAALYCGWYSLKKYVDAFDWQPGSVGYHIASGECTTLKKQNSQVWCKRMLEKGVVATLGPVSEPYVEAFPPPAIFFGLLTEGRFTLAECYAASNPFWSWQMVLIGDPLYRPFKNQKHF